MIDITKKKLVNFSVLMYFLFLILTNQSSNYIFFVGFYISLILCGVFGFYSLNFRVNKKRIVIIFLLAALTFINMLTVGNATLNDVIFVVLYSLAAFSFTNEELDEKIPLIGFGMNVVVILYKIATVGVITGQLFVSSSRNYVSVFLMYPLVIYYSIIARKNKDINMIPLLIDWVMCLIARGRGGIISCTFFLIAVYIVKYKNMRSLRRLVATALVLLGLSFVVLNLSSILENLGASAVMEMFARNGLESSRTRFWPEYIHLATSNFKNFMLGADISNTFIGRYLDGNPHNSFIEIHMFSGIIGLALVVYASVRNGVRCVKENKPLFLVCMIAMYIRAFTDHVLWASYGTPVLFFIMFYLDSKSADRSVLEEGESWNFIRGRLSEN